MHKERPILFNGDMVRALLDGRKTQTRRLVKPAPEMVTHKSIEPWEGDAKALMALLERNKRGCPYGKTGDRLWVKETWRPQGVLSPWDLEVTYAADGEQRIIKDGEFGDKDWNMPKAAARGNVSPLFMPRWASRITLEIVSVRVERLQAIDASACQSEGCAGGHGAIPGYGYSASPKEHFHHVWESINGTGSWYANPWVWVVEFKRVEANQ